MKVQELLVLFVIYVTCKSMCVETQRKNVIDVNICSNAFVIEPQVLLLVKFCTNYDISEI